MNKKVIVWVITVIVVAAAFYGGMLYQKNKTASAAGNMATGQNVRTGGAGRFRNANGGFAGGQILSKDATSITVQLPNNAGTKIVFLSDSSQILKSVAGSAADLAVGQQVVVMGS